VDVNLRQNRARLCFFVLRLLALLIVCKEFLAGAESNWPAWRGPHDNGNAEPGTYPVNLEPSNAMWTTTLPGKGCSTPIVWDNRIFLSAPTNGLDAVLAFDWDGKPLWLTSFSQESPGAHRNGSGCNPSPATDGKTVFVRFKSGTVAALDLNGALQWQTNLTEAFGPENLYWDQGTSPVLTRSDVVIARMHGGESWIAAFEKASGRMRWKTQRTYETPSEDDHAYSTPLVLEQAGKQTIFVWGALHLTAYDAADGKLLWSCNDFNPQAVPNWPSVASPVVADNMAIVACGRADRGAPRLYGIKLGGKGDVTATHHVWKREDSGTFVPTPAVVDGKIYLLRDRGELDCLDPATGKTLWHAAFPKGSANYYASPLVAGDLLYAAREDGVVFVARIRNKFDLVSQNHLDDHVIASPVAVASRLFIRGEHHLFCFGPPL
jgi:outer membrane protein assembly factor BamB